MITWGGRVQETQYTRLPVNHSNKSKLNKKRNLPQADTEAAAPRTRTIKLGIDAHPDRYMVVRIIVGDMPQPLPLSGPPEFVLCIAK